MPRTVATGDFGPAPPNIDLSDNQNAKLSAPVALVAICGTVAVLLRFFIRIRAKDVRLALDDYLVGLALFFSWGTAISCFLSIPYGNGYHLPALSRDEFIVVWKILLAFVMIYATAVTFTKASIVMFYGRIFNLRWMLWIALFLVIGYWITIIVAILVACRPLAYFWLAYTDPLTAEGTCMDIPTFFFANGIAAMLIDVLILCIPIPNIYKLQMPLSQKIAVAGIFLLGGFVCAASICRIVSLDANRSGTDATWTMAAVFIWSSVEPFVGIICACLPVFGPFFRRWWTEIKTMSSRSRQTNNNSADHPPGMHTWLQKHGLGRNKVPKDSVFSVNGFGCVDEVQLMNDINASRSVRDAASSDHDVEIGDSGGNIMVKQDVDVTWSQFGEREGDSNRK